MGKTQIAQRKQRIEWLEKYMKSKGSENKKKLWGRIQFNFGVTRKVAMEYINVLIDIGVLKKVGDFYKYADDN